HESLNLNQARGLLAAVTGNPATYPGLVSIYDVHNDCRHPVLQSTAPVARLGHESGFSIDGHTFYATGTATQSITAIDVTDPQNPHAVWQGNVLSHGMQLSDDGNRAYVISNLTAPREIAYFVAPPVKRVENGGTDSDFAMWQPVIVPERREVWYTDGESGFYVLRVDKDAWPGAAGSGSPGSGGSGG